MKRTASAEKNSNSSASSGADRKARGFGYVLCVDARRYPVSLEARKVYRSKPDTGAERHGLIRVIDDSGEDYLYAAKRFVPIHVPKAARRLF